MHPKPRTICMLIVALFVFSAAPAIATDVSGRWTGTISLTNGPTEAFLLILKQDGATLTGTAGANQSDRHTVEKGAVDGDRITFEVHAADGVVLVFDLKIKGEEMSGTLTMKSGDTVLNSAQLSVKR